MTDLANLRWAPRWNSFAGCLQACLGHLGHESSDGWLYGATGHAFVMNIHDEVCPSGPTAWDMRQPRELFANLGGQVELIAGSGQGKTPTEAQQRAWDHARAALDRGHPCFGWELSLPEYYVIHGYDEQGYYYSGPDCKDGTGPKPWQELGATPIGMVLLHSVKPVEPAAPEVTVAAALEFVLRFAREPGDWVFRGYQSGLAGYDAWIAALDEGRAMAIGVGYNAAVWTECRRNAVEFLTEARERLSSAHAPLLEEAQHHYETVTERLMQVIRCYPFSSQLPEGPLPKDATAEQARQALTEARAAEEAGLEALAQLHQSMP